MIGKVDKLKFQLPDMKRIGRKGLFGFGVVFTILGLFLFGIAYSSYQNSNSNYVTCLKDWSVTYCNTNSPIISWGVPLQIAGVALTAFGLGLVVVAFLGMIDGNEGSSDSDTTVCRICL